MNRAFEQHKVRDIVSLDGEWYFITDPENNGTQQGYNASIPKGAKRRYVPSVWNTDLGLLEYCGAAWYVREFNALGGAVRLHFGAVMTVADVWVDGEPVGHHYGGFTSFDVDIPMLSKGTHILSVRVDNSFDGASIPEKQVDWYHYGGITRSVTLSEMIGIGVLSVKADYSLDLEARSASMRLRVRLKNFDSTRDVTELKITMEKSLLVSDEISLEAWEEKEFTYDGIELSDLRIWDVGASELYTVYVRTDTDDLYDRIGFREIRAEKGKIYLNGKELTIKGVCRHEEHPDFGSAFPEGLMERDIDIIQNMNANAIRGSHYPNAQYFVDLLDERGVLFWSEIPIWGVGYSEEMIAIPKFVERAHEMIKEMSEQYHNHPSIIIWGIHNEIPSDTENGLALSKLLYGELKTRNDGRLITYASARPMKDICFEYCDIICINQYVGWYNGEIGKWEKAVNEFRRRREALGMTDKPVIYSEFGAAAIYGHHTFDDIRWTEEYQARLIDHCIRLFLSDDMICGCYVWQYCDIRTCTEMGLNRARGFNNKGLVNEYRRPKMAYGAVKKAYSEF
ncbi:MAG: beta-glucuronidase [Clostridia bacterium]|nr:beta-glucuronidase [Clostridia bacterium]